MSDKAKKGELLPPLKGTQLSDIPPPRRGVLESSLTGFGAKLRSRVLRRQADELRAKTDYQNARGELAQSYLRAARSIDEVRDLDEILETDRDIRRAQRAAARADAQRLRLEAENYKEYVERTGSKNLDIQMAYREEKLAQFKQGKEPPQPPPAVDPVQDAIDKLTLAVQEAEGRGLGDTPETDKLRARLDLLRKAKDLEQGT